jgi:hypothetical protein
MDEEDGRTSGGRSRRGLIDIEVQFDTVEGSVNDIFFNGECCLLGLDGTHADRRK